MAKGVSERSASFFCLLADPSNSKFRLLSHSCHSNPFHERWLAPDTEIHNLVRIRTRTIAQEQLHYHPSFMGYRFTASSSITPIFITC